MTTDRRTVGEAILGASDGAFTGLGLVLATVTGLGLQGLLRVALTTAVAGTASMALGELQKDNEVGWREAAAMGVSWLALCLLPVFAIYLGFGWWAVIAILLSLGIAITYAREGKWTRVGWAKTYGLMIAVAAPTILVAFVI